MCFVTTMLPLLSFWWVNVTITQSSYTYCTYSTCNCIGSIHSYGYCLSCECILTFWLVLFVQLIVFSYLKTKQRKELLWFCTKVCVSVIPTLMVCVIIVLFQLIEFALDLICRFSCDPYLISWRTVQGSRKEIWTTAA